MNKNIQELKEDYIKNRRKENFLCECEFCKNSFLLINKTAKHTLKNQYLLCRKCKIKYTKSKVSKEEQEEINKKRENTFLKKYNVITTLTTEKARNALSKIDQKKRVEKIKETKKKNGTLDKRGIGLKDKNTYNKTKESLKRNKNVDSYFEIINKERSKIKYEKIKKEIEGFSEVLNDQNTFSVVDKTTKKNTLILLKCKTCGTEYINTKTNDIKRCPLCFPEDWASKKQSKGERKIIKFLEENSIKYIPQKIFEELKGDTESPLRFDFFLPDYNMCIEYQGKQHFFPYDNTEKERQALLKRQRYDKKKEEYCKNKNIYLEKINYTEKIDLRLQEIFSKE